MEDAKSKFARDRIKEIKDGKLNATQIGTELRGSISGKQIRKVRQWKANIAGYDIIFVEGYTKSNGQNVSSYMRRPPNSNYTLEDVMNKYNASR